MKYGLFITGTDTGVGKTEITLALMEGLHSKGYAVAGMKPVASGCEKTDEGLRNQDALRIQARASVKLSYDQVSPYSFAEPIAPHIAAERKGVQIDLQKIKHDFDRNAANVDIMIVEGVGGWKVPLFTL